MCWHEPTSVCVHVHTYGYYMPCRCRLGIVYAVQNHAVCVCTVCSEECYLLLSWRVCRVSACLAGALVVMQCRLDKLNPIIRPLMEVVKRERNSSMQV